MTEIAWARLFAPASRRSADETAVVAVPIASSERRAPQPKTMTDAIEDQERV